MFANREFSGLRWPWNGSRRAGCPGHRRSGPLGAVPEGDDAIEGLHDDVDSVLVLAGLSEAHDAWGGGP